MGIPVKKAMPKPNPVQSARVAILAKLKSVTPPSEQVPATKRNRRRKAGLWFSSMKVEIQPVRNAMRTDCIVCSKRPEERRLFVKHGGGRHCMMEVFCIECGVTWLQQKIHEGQRAVGYLTSGQGEVRL